MSYEDVCVVLWINLEGFTTEKNQLYRYNNHLMQHTFSTNAEMHRKAVTLTLLCNDNVCLNNPRSVIQIPVFQGKWHHLVLTKGDSRCLSSVIPPDCWFLRECAANSFSAAVKHGGLGLFFNKSPLLLLLAAGMKHKLFVREGCFSQNKLFL